MQKVVFLLIAMAASLSVWAESHTATVVVSPEGYGTVQIGMGSNWSAEGYSASITAEPGQIIVLRNTPSVGCTFVDYYGYYDDQPLAINMTPDGDIYYFNMPNADVAITAVFEETPHTDRIYVDNNNFPDDNFRNWVLSQEFGEDGVLTVDEIAEVTTIDVGFEEIADLTGIGYFYALTELSCPFNELTELDLSQNTCLTFLNCEVNQLTKLDFSHNEQIRWIGFDVNRIKGENMDNLIASLPTVENGSGSLFAINHYSGEQNVITAIQVSAAEAKGWIVMDDNGNVYSGSYTITLPESFENGSVICDKTEAAEGETVTLTVTPNNGYELETLTVTTVDGEPSGAPMLRLRGGSVELTPGENGTYTFEMPAAPVTINATFKETTVTGLIDLDAVQPKSGQRYNMMGQPVGKDYKGIVIEDGVKKIVK